MWKAAAAAALALVAGMAAALRVLWEHWQHSLLGVAAVEGSVRQTLAVLAAVPLGAIRLPALAAV
jgi:hypothetical protein